MTDITVAVAESAAASLFNQLRDNFALSDSGSRDTGAFSVDWAAGFKLQGGRFDFQESGSVRISELDIVYDPLRVTFGIDIPRICVGGFCIIPNPFGGCILRAPRLCLFEADPDIRIPIDLGGLIRSEVSGSFSFRTRLFSNPGRTAGMTDLDAHEAGVPNKWQLFLDPRELDIDLIDIADTVGNIVQRFLDSIVDTLFGSLPGWARDLLSRIVGSFVGLIRRILDIVDDIDEWLSNLLGVSIGLFDMALQLVAEYFARKEPVFEFETPYPIMPAASGLIPVLVPVNALDVTVNDQELVLEAAVG